MKLRHRRLLGLALVLLTGLGLSSCSKSLTSALLPNQPPTVRLTNAPYDSTGRYYYAVTLNWTGYDPDGRISYYLYAVDPPTASHSDTAWIRTTQSEQQILFPTTHPIGANSIYAEDPHTFVLKAVDNRGTSSPVVDRAFFSNTIAPTCQIKSPTPLLNNLVFVTPSVLIQWDGNDVDGVQTKRPVKYKYKLLSDQTDVTVNAAIFDRDSVRRYYAARNWAGWDSTSAETTLVQLRGLAPETEYIFCVISFDEAGAYSPKFELNNNMLHFRVTFAGNNNPTITFFNQFFVYTYPGGSYEPLNPARIIPLQVPANRPVTFNWFAVPNTGSDMRSYRWALDIQDLNDETERTDQQNDLSHWSPKSLSTTSATLPGFPGGAKTYKFYLEAEDVNGLKSLGIIGFQSIQPTFAKTLGIFNDTRGAVDQKSLATQTCPNPPQQRWPSAAELDTFLFARGGYPWKCYPTGTVSTPGIFAGYAFDTVGTRNGRVDQTVDLATLGTYTHVVWLVDINGYSNTSDGNKPTPMSALKYMGIQNRLNTLGVYQSQGGILWLAGESSVFSTMALVSQFGYDKSNNNNGGQGATISAANGELIPGRFPYDVLKWQSEAIHQKIQGTISRSLGRNQNNAFYVNSHAPLNMRMKDPSLDVFPPIRNGQSLGNFYFQDTFVEYLNNQVPNNYLEDVDPVHPGVDFRSGLDTVYAGTAGQMVAVPASTSSDPPINALMTIYPARNLPTASSIPQVIVTGFNLWDFTRDDCQGLVDFVLQDLWGMHKNVPFAGAQRASQSAVPGAPPVWSPPTSKAAPATSPASIASVRTARAGVEASRKPR